MDEKTPPPDMTAFLDAILARHRAAPTPETQSPTIGALVAALATVEMPAVEKRSRNSHLGNMYASLDDVIASTRPALKKAGLVVLQTFSPSKGGVTVVTTLAHTSGEWIRGAMYLPSPPAKGLSEEQTYGKAATYGRRYGYTAMLSIAAEEDDDASIVRDSRDVRRDDRPQQAVSSSSRGGGGGGGTGAGQGSTTSGPRKSADTYIGEMKLAVNLVELRNIAARVNKDQGLSSDDRKRCSEAFNAEKANLEKKPAATT